MRPIHTKPQCAPLLCALLCALLVACGGGSDDAPTCLGGVLYGPEGVPVTRSTPASLPTVQSC